MVSARVCIVFSVCQKNLGDTGYPGGMIRDVMAVGSCHENIYVAKLCGSGDCIQRRTLQFGIVVIGKNKHCHEITFASFRSLSTRPATFFDHFASFAFRRFNYFKRCQPGSDVDTHSAGVVSSIGFFFAFIIFGSEAYLGVFRRKSVVITAGSFRFSLSSPAVNFAGNYYASLAQFQFRCKCTL